MKGAETVALRMLVKLLKNMNKEEERAARSWRESREQSEDTTYEIAHADGRACGVGLPLNEVKEVVNALIAEQ